MYVTYNKVDILSTYLSTKKLFFSRLLNSSKSLLVNTRLYELNKSFIVRGFFGGLFSIVFLHISLIYKSSRTSIKKCLIKAFNWRNHLPRRESPYSTIISQQSCCIL
jgi:hypothetical protein